MGDFEFSRETERFRNSIVFYVNDSTSEQTADGPTDRRTDGKSLFGVAAVVRFREIALASIQLGAKGND